MADSIRRVTYFYVEAPDKPGEGACYLSTLKKAGVDLVAFSGFPLGRGRAQLDFMPADPGAFRRVARRDGWNVKGPKTGFLVQGKDRVGAVHDLLGRLGGASINVTAIDGVSAGKGRFGAIFWVKAKDAARAARTLGAR